MLFSIVPFGQTNVYSMPIDLTVWGKPGDNEKAAVEKLKYHGFYLSHESQKSNKSGATSSQEMASFTAGRSVWLSPAEVNNNNYYKLYSTLPITSHRRHLTPAIEHDF